jgi:hypothetical protein
MNASPMGEPAAVLAGAAGVPLAAVPADGGVAGGELGGVPEEHAASAVSAAAASPQTPPRRALVVMGPPNIGGPPRPLR